MINRNYKITPNENNNFLSSNVNYEYNPEAAYGDHISNTGAICNTSASHTCGNVLSVVEKSLLDKFPMDLFKTVTASSTLASKQIKHLPHQLHKNERPMMVLVPRISFGQGDDRFLANTIINSQRTDTHSYWGDGSLLNLAMDRRQHLWIHGHFNRMVVFIDVILSFDTYNEQINYMSYIHNLIPINHNKLIRAPLELYIPIEFCELISNVTKVPIIDQSNSVVSFLSYMNKIWGYPITYKLKGGSNSNEFFMYYLTDIDMVVQEPQMDAPAKNGQVKQNYNISFTVRAEFNTIGYFTLDHPNVRKTVLEPKEQPKIFTIFSDEINLQDFYLPTGWVVLSWPIFKLKPGENSISIDSLFNESIRTVINYHLRASIPIERFLSVQFRENGRILDEGFYIDWESRTLYLLHPNNHRTYRLIITISPQYINDMIKQLYNLE